MKLHSSDNSFAVGSTLIEAIIAIGVLAVVIPLVFGALAESGKCGTAAQAETRSTWIIPACLDEIHASREGHPQYFTATMNGQTIPPVGEVWALAFSADGKPVGKLSKVAYESGTREIDGKPIRYIALLSSAAAAITPGTTPMLNLRIVIEYPAAARAAKRGKIDFLTRIP